VAKINHNVFNDTLFNFSLTLINGVLSQQGILNNIFYPATRRKEDPEKS
jgi:hypothetical protein